MGQCVSTTGSKNQKPTEKKPGQPGSKSEQNSGIGTKEDIKIRKSDFVFQHRNTKFSDLYKIDDQVLGSGGYGTVQKCWHKETNQLRAVKIMKKSKINKSDWTRLRYEIDILKNLDHPNILRLYEVFEDKNCIYLVTEMCDGGELFDEIINRGKFEEKDAAPIMKQLLSAVAYCHKRNVCHRDLKPENVLLDSKDKGTIKLIDFGTSQVFENEEKMELVLGTAYYIAPEVLSGKYDEKCDIWSIGVILYILLSGEPPFPGDTDQEIINKVKKGKYSFNRPIWRSRSTLVKQFISQLMNVDANERLTAQQALEHPWIQQKAVEQLDSNQIEATTDALQNLKKFRAEQKLQQAALTFIVCQMTTKEEQEKLYNSFKALDKNSDGKISKEELIEGYKKIYPHLSDEDIVKEANKLFDIADQDGSGEIDYSEWQVATINKYNVLSENKLKTAFHMFDRDGSGAISAKEIKEVLGVSKKFGNESIWDDIIKEVDINGDGEISYDEFKIMMQKMGNFCNCQHDYQVDRINEVDQAALQKVTSLNDLKLSAKDFIAFQKGKFLDHYDLDKLLGEGAFGQVYQCFQKQTRVIRAVKTLLKTGFYNEEERERFRSEVNLLSQMDHPNILKLYEVYQDDARFYVVTELCSGGELFDEIVKRQRFSEKDAAEIMNQVLLAVNYCHQNSISHRDLKPENILIESEGRIKVIDFGTAIAFSPEQGMNNMLGTPYYMAPEIFNSQRYDEKVDCWSLGVILYCMLTGQPPFYGKTDADVIQKVKLGVYPKQVLNEKGISQQAQDLIEKLLTLDPEQRISASNALDHDWIQQIGIKDTNLDHAREALGNLQSFSADQKMQQAVLTYIVSQLMSHEEIENTKQIFQSLDINHDGKLSRDELIVGYKKLYGDFAEEEVDKIMRLADTDGSGEIDYTEWLTATLNRKSIISDEKLKNAFIYFDKDGSGAISIEELKEVLGVKKLVDDQVWQALIKEIDADGNGEIDFDEFKTMMTKLVEVEINQSHQMTTAKTASTTR